MPHMIDIRVLELLCSRLCHDLISPVTAINNGMELLEDDSGDMFDDVRGLLTNSASEGSGKRQYYRLAYGGGGDPGGEIGIIALLDESFVVLGHGIAGFSVAEDELTAGDATVDVVDGSRDEQARVPRHRIPPMRGRDQPILLIHPQNQQVLNIVRGTHPHASSILITHRHSARRNMDRLRS